MKNLSPKLDMHRLIKKLTCITFCLFSFSLLVQAHVGEIRVKNNGDGTLTWFSLTYGIGHGICKDTATVLEEHGLTINGQNYSYSDSGDGSIEGFSNEVVFIDQGSLDLGRVYWASVTTPYFAPIEILIFSSDCCWLTDENPAVISYYPPESVPTLSEWGLILLGLILFIVGTVAIKYNSVPIIQETSNTAN